jgi:hypothetical protein
MTAKLTSPMTSRQMAMTVNDIAAPSGALNRWPNLLWMNTPIIDVFGPPMRSGVT